jgi:hypothetical protein
MARNVNVSWVLPTTRVSGRPLDPADIADVQLSLSADGVNWSPYDAFLPDVLSTVIPELEVGEWFVQGVVRDTNNRVSSPVVASVVVPDESAPGNLVSLVLTF